MTEASSSSVQAVLPMDEYVYRLGEENTVVRPKSNPEPGLGRHPVDALCECGEVWHVHRWRTVGDTSTDDGTCPKFVPQRKKAEVDWGEYEVDPDEKTTLGEIDDVPWNVICECGKTRANHFSSQEAVYCVRGCRGPERFTPKRKAPEPATEPAELKRGDYEWERGLNEMPQSVSCHECGEPKLTELYRRDAPREPGRYRKWYCPSCYFKPVEGVEWDLRVDSSALPCMCCGSEGGGRWLGSPYTSPKDRFRACPRCHGWWTDWQKSLVPHVADLVARASKPPTKTRWPAGQRCPDPLDTPEAAPSGDAEPLTYAKMQAAIRAVEAVASEPSTAPEPDCPCGHGEALHEFEQDGEGCMAIACPCTKYGSVEPEVEYEVEADSDYSSRGSSTLFGAPSERLCECGHRAGGHRDISEPYSCSKCPCTAFKGKVKRKDAVEIKPKTMWSSPSITPAMIQAQHVLNIQERLGREALTRRQPFMATTKEEEMDEASEVKTITTDAGHTILKKCPGCTRPWIRDGSYMNADNKGVYPKIRRGVLTQKCSCGYKHVSKAPRAGKPNKDKVTASISGVAGYGVSVDGVHLSPRQLARMGMPWHRRLRKKLRNIALVFGTGAFVDHRWGSEFADWAGMGAAKAAALFGWLIG